jgi:hypothetical protein
MSRLHLEAEGAPTFSGRAACYLNHFLRPVGAAGTRLPRLKPASNHDCRRALMVDFLRKGFDVEVGEIDFRPHFTTNQPPTCEGFFMGMV